MIVVNVNGENRGIKVKAVDVERILYDVWFAEDLKEEKPSLENWVMKPETFQERFRSIKI